MSAMLKCKVCGKLYQGCLTMPKPDELRWQDVACSRECGSIFFAQIMEARKPKIDGVKKEVEIVSADPADSTDFVDGDIDYADDYFDEFDEYELDEWESDDEFFGDEE